MSVLNKFLLVSIILNITIAQAQNTTKNMPAEYPFGAPGSSSRGVFGEDDRHDVNEVYGIEDYTRATAVMIPKSSVEGNKIYGQSLKQMLSTKFITDSMDENVRFQNQPTMANCTGFLVAPDILVSAGHCILTIDDARNWYWLFDYTNEFSFNAGDNHIVFNRENLYEVTDVIGAALDGEGDERADYAVLRLNRKVERIPYRIRSSGKPSINTNVYTIGAPTGLPLKISTNSKVLDNERSEWFKSDIDCFPGNSGGPVFDPNGFIEGIIVRTAVEAIEGDYAVDYKYDEDCDCVKTVTFENANNNAGSHVQKLNTLPEELIKVIIYDNLESAIDSNDNSTFKRWAVYSWMFYDSYTTQRGSFESLAIKNNNHAVLKELIEINSERYDSNVAHSILKYALDSDSLLLKETALEKMDLDAVDTLNISLLQYYASMNNLNQLKMLITYGANKYSKDDKGNTILHIAAQYGTVTMVDYLLEEGLEANLKNNSGLLPEKIAQKAKHKSVAKKLKKARKAM